MISFILFSTSTCAHCKPMKKTLEELATKYPDDVLLKVHVLDTDEKSMVTAKQWNVRAVPTTVIIYNQEQIGQLEGAQPLASLEKLVEGIIQPDILQESPGGSNDTCRPVLCDSSEQKDAGTDSN